MTTLISLEAPSTNTANSAMPGKPEVTSPDEDDGVIMSDHDRGTAALKAPGYSTKLETFQPNGRFNKDQNVCILADVHTHPYYKIVAIAWTVTDYGKDEKAKGVGGPASWTFDYAYALLDDESEAMCDLMILKEEYLTVGPLWAEGDVIELRLVVSEKDDINLPLQIETVVYDVKAGWLYKLLHAADDDWIEEATLNTTAVGGGINVNEVSLRRL